MFLANSRKDLYLDLQIVCVKKFIGIKYSWHATLKFVEEYKYVKCKTLLEYTLTAVSNLVAVD